MADESFTYPQPPASNAIWTYRDGATADAPVIRDILLEARLSAPAVGDLERGTHSRIGEVRTAVCEEGKQIIGILQWRVLGEECELLDLAVRPGQRRRGCAGFLLRNFLSHASQAGAREIYLEVRESNVAAIALYKKFGFTQSGRRPGYYRNPGEAALLMRLELLS